MVGNYYQPLHSQQILYLSEEFGVGSWRLAYLASRGAQTIHCFRCASRPLRLHSFIYCLFDPLLFQLHARIAALPLHNFDTHTHTHTHAIRYCFPIGEAALAYSSGCRLLFVIFLVHERVRPAF